MRQGNDECEYCDPDHLGTAERFEELVRKSADPRLAAFFASMLADAPDAPDTPDGGDVG